MALFRSFLVCLLAIVSLSAAEPPKIIYVLPVRDEIESSMLYQVRRGIKEAMGIKASALILDMNTPGGEGEAMKDIMEALGKFEPSGETYTLVDKDAFSAGAFISAATRHIYMTPGSKIGAASPITMGQRGIEELPPKFVSAFAGIIRAAAEQNGHNPLVFEAMVNKQKGLNLDGKEIVGKGDILTLTTIEAGQLYGHPPKPLLSEGTVPDLQALVNKIGGPNARIVTFEPSGYEKLGRVMSMVAPFLLTAAFILAYLEFKMPGTMLFGIAAVVCFVLFFCGHYVSGLSGYEPIIAFFIGLALVMLEVFVLPGMLAPALIGFGLIFGAIIYSMIDRYPGEPLVPTIPQLELPATTLALSLLFTIVVAMIIARYLPRRLLFGELEAATAAGPATRTADQLRVGARGVAVTPLRPAGAARFDDRLLDVVSDGMMIDPGAEVVVNRIEGMLIVVEPAREAAKKS